MGFDNTVLVFAILKVTGQLFGTVLKRIVGRTNASQADGLAVWYILAYVRGMAAGGEEILMGICGFTV